MVSNGDRRRANAVADAVVTTVGFNNHPFFLAFVGSLVLGIIFFDVLAVGCEENLLTPLIIS